jgi:hypothetical protein
MLKEANKGKSNPKISEKLKGRKFSEEHKKKLSKVASKRKLITNGVKRKWLHEGDVLPKGWFYVKRS